MIVKLVAPATGTIAIKPFFFLTYKCVKLARVSIHSKPFQASLTFVGKARGLIYNTSFSS
jgi:hypothetical protein